MGKLRFNDVITYEKFKDHLEISNALCYISGTGSGKSYWVENVLYKHGRVLFVTSRRSKLDQDLTHVDTTWNINEILNEQNDRHHLVTNHGLATIVNAATTFRDDGFPKNYCLDQYINLFDYIVIDEVHSIISDASFSDDACIVQYFMEYAVDMGKNVILLTATDKLLGDYLETPIGKKGKRWYKEDITNDCMSTLPRLVKKITSEYALKKIFTEYIGIHKIIYFVNKTSTIKDYYKLFTEGENEKKKKFMPKSEKLLKENQIAVMVSDNSKELLEDKNIITLYSELAEERLKQSQTLPDETMVLMATSRLKEGVSIKNDGEFIVVCDSHNIVDLVQYMGRLREAKYKLYIISDSVPHDDMSDELAYNFSRTEEVDAANKFFRTLTFANDKRRFVTLIEKDRRYIRFDPIRQEFKTYFSRYRIECFQKNMDVVVDKEHKCAWEYDLKEFCEKNRIFYDYDIKYYELNIDDVINELKSKFYVNDKPMELYGGSLAELKKYIQVKFDIKHSRITEMNDDLRKILDNRARIEINKLKYGKPSDKSIASKKHIYVLDIEKL